MRYRVSTACVASLTSSVIAQKSFPVQWSSTQYGPDGPWQAVTAWVGGTDPSVSIFAQSTAVDLYPGGSYDTFVLTSSACQDPQDPWCGAGHVWDNAPSSSNIQYQETWSDAATGLMSSKSTIYTTEAFSLQAIPDRIQPVFNTTLVAITQVSIPNPSGGSYGPEVGVMALGASNAEEQQFSLGSTSSYIRGWLFSAYLYNQSITPSYSYGLQIGSAALGYNASLVFGGFDKGRVIGPYTTFATGGTASLIDIGIGVETGASPFELSSYSGLLQSSTSGSSELIPVFTDPLTPYLSLPSFTCNAIAKLLPVTLDSNTGYYLWDTSNQKYKTIINSPAYLSFTFPPAPGDTDNVVIKVPFALLDLTLEAPLVSNPTPYFPCRAFEPASGDKYRLGRAFLQAAFLGANWLTQTTWLAQAPGPGPSGQGMGIQYTDIQATDTTIDVFESSSLFNNSWSGHWTPLASVTAAAATPELSASQSPVASQSPESSQDSNGSSGASGSKLSNGAKIGIGVGIGLGVLLLIALGAVLLFYRKKAVREEQPTYSTLDVANAPYRSNLSEAAGREVWRPYQNGMQPSTGHHGPVSSSYFVKDTYHEAPSDNPTFVAPKIAQELP